MSWQIVNKGGEKPFCVVKKGEEVPILGGRHRERTMAVEHLQSLYSSEAADAVAQSFIENESSIELSDLTPGDPWSGYIAFEGVSTGDNRSFSSGSITFGEFPLPFLWQKTSQDGHSGSWVIGRVDDATKDEDGKIFANGILLDTPEAQEYKILLEAGAAGGVSIDGDSAEYKVEEGQEKGQHTIEFSSIRVRALTAVAVPAFAGAKITLTKDSAVELDLDATEKKTKQGYSWSEEKGLMASAPVRPPGQWFENQRLPGPTPSTVLEDGQVFGHLALWGTCHIGMPQCTAPPKGGTYAYFHTGALTTWEGDDISVGHLTFNTGHAGLYDNAANAASHYDHTGTVAADVVVGEDKYGIWFAGALRPHLSDVDTRVFKAAPLSGDWRRIGARLELVAALSVNTPGFPVPRTKVLVADGRDSAFITIATPEDFESFGRQSYKEDLAERVTGRLNNPKG